MEDLVHGLINVALGRDVHGDEANRPNNSRPLEERSRSTWAQVVSSGQDDKEKEEEEEDVYSTQFGSRKEEKEERNDGGWETVGHKKLQAHHSSRMPLKVAYNGQEDEEEYGPEKSFNSYSSELGSRKEKNEGQSDEGWETVEHKTQPHRPSRIPHKVPVDNWHQYKQPPSEQEYINEGHHGMDIEPSREELADLSKACSRLWELDSNRLVPGKDYEIDCAEGKKVYEKEDMASGSLFRWLSDDVFRRPTYGRFCSLLDNYNPNEGYKEVVTPQEKHEQVAFIEEITRTAPIRYLHKHLVSKGIATEGYEEFKRMMTSLWFDLHGRGGGSSCSSDFEHVFVGEVKGRNEKEISGFHNWVQFYLEEAKGHVDYQGYIFPRRRGQVPDSEAQLLTVQFEWNGVLKSLSSTFIGVSPEFEIALYTLCFFVGREDNHVDLGPYSVNIKCYHLGNNRIGSVFPIAES